MFVIGKVLYSDSLRQTYFYTGYGWSTEYPDAQEYLRRRAALHDAKLAVSPEHSIYLTWNYGAADQTDELITGKSK